ncbi:MAG: leucine-rich repeat domain-containing protein [Tissierellia bacterium]|nr:leucine-rich repeat domain-containing protein [Tissierellia bacterium]
MKKVLVLLMVFLLVACGGNNKAQDSPVDAKKDSTEETVDKAPEEPKQVVIKYIESDEEDYNWPGASPEEDFLIDKESGTITEYKGKDAILVIPSSIDGTQVKALGEKLFYENHDLTHVYIPDGVELIDSYCFNSCFNIVKLRLPSDLQVVGPLGLFGLNQLEELTFPKSLAYLDFASLGFTPELKKISFLGEFPAIHYEAFDREDMLNKVLRVADEEKEDFERFFEIEITTDGACNYLDDLAEDKDLVLEGDTLIGYSGNAKTISLPEGIKKIGKEAFMQVEGLIRVKLPASLEEIEEAAFIGTGLKQVKFKEGLKKIGDKAFSGASLVDLALPSSIESLGERSFPSLNLQNLSLPQGLKEIPKDCFTQSDIYRIDFPDSIEKIGPQALSNNSRLSYLVFDGYQPPKIDDSAFQKSNLDDIDIPWDASKAEALVYTQLFEKQELASEGFTVWRADPPNGPGYPVDNAITFDEVEGLVTKVEGPVEEMTMFWNFYSSEIDDFILPVMGLGEAVFEKSSIKRFFIPHSNEFRTIGKRAFAGSQLEKIHLFDSMEAIYDEAFKDCKNLKEIIIPDGLRYIGKEAFAGCENLENLVFKGYDIHIEKDAFKGCDKLTQVVLPLGIEAEEGLGLNPEIIVFDNKASDEDLKRLGEAIELPWYLNPRREKDPETFIKMPDTDFTSAEDFEFDKKTGTITKYKGQNKKVVVPREIDGVKVEVIGQLAFFMMSAEGEDDLKEVVLPETIKHIEDSAFLICETLEKLTCYGPVERVGNRAFEDAVSLKEVSFVNGVKEFDIFTFHQCHSLEKINMPLLKEVPESCFQDCNLKGDIRLDLEVIGPRSFKGCKNISSITIGKEIKLIDEAAFTGCSGLKEIIFEKIEPGLFEGFAHFYEAGECDFILPAGTTEEEKDAFIKDLLSTGLTGFESRVKIR